MSIPDNFLAFTFPNSIFDGSITDAGGTIVYTLTSEKRKFRSDTTTITRPDAGVVGVIRWGSVITLRRRSVALANATVPTKKYLSEGKANSLGGRDSQAFQDLDGNEYYWKNSECYEGKNKTLVAYYKLAVVDNTLSPRLWVHPEYCSPNVVEPIIITSLLMAKMKKKSSESADPARISSDAASSRTSHETSSSQRHGTRAAYAGVAGAVGAGGAVGAYALASGVENDGGAYAYEGANNYGGVTSYGSGPGDFGGGGGAGGDYGGADGGGAGAAFGGADAGGYGGGFDGGAGGGYGGGFDGGAGGGAGGGFGGADGGGGYGGGGFGGGYGGGFGGGGGSW